MNESNMNNQSNMNSQNNMNNQNNINVVNPIYNNISTGNISNVMDNIVRYSSS